MAAAFEVEAKTRLSPEDLEKVYQSFIKKAVATVKNRTVTRAYYDTPALDLYKNGLSLRLEAAKGEQTLKIEAPSGSDVLSRHEYTDAAEGSQPSLANVSAPDAQSVIRPFLGRELVHVFTSDIGRRAFDVKISASLVEFAFDVGALVLPDGTRRDFHEIEVELKRGNPDVLAAVQAEIMTLAPSAAAQPLSKAAQGSQLYLQQPGSRSISA